MSSELLRGLMKFRMRKRERLILQSWLQLPAELRQQYRLLNKPRHGVKNKKEGGTDEPVPASFA
jgi:hypothetical protein